MMKLNEIRLSASVTLAGAGALSIAGAPLGSIGYGSWYHAFSYVALTIALCLVAAIVPRHPIMLGLYGLIATAIGVVGSLTLWEAGIGGGNLVPESSMRIVSLTLLAGAPLVLLLSLLAPHRHSDTMMYVALAVAIPLTQMFSAGVVSAWSVSGWLLVVAGFACAAGLRSRRTTEALAQPQPWVAA